MDKGRLRLELNLSKANIKGWIIVIHNAKDYFKIIEKQLYVSDKAIRSSLMSKYSTLKYEGFKITRKNKIEMKILSSIKR